MNVVNVTFENLDSDWLQFLSLTLQRPNVPQLDSFNLNMIINSAEEGNRFNQYSWPQCSKISTKLRRVDEKNCKVLFKNNWQHNIVPPAPNLKLLHEGRKTYLPHSDSDKYLQSEWTKISHGIRKRNVYWYTSQTQPSQVILVLPVVSDFLFPIDSFVIYGIAEVLPQHATQRYSLSSTFRFTCSKDNFKAILKCLSCIP